MKLNEAFEFFQEMDKAGVSISPYSYQCLFEACRELRYLYHGRLLHDRMRMKCENPSVILQNELCASDVLLVWELRRCRKSETRLLLPCLLQLLKYLVKSSPLGSGRQVHAHVIRAGLCSNASIETRILNMYVKCGWLVGAKLAFDQMAVKKLEEQEML
ncbi:unnamed protein product [Microthlaspi erraticum]|uniref:Pentacotripeptide-repeat region of PRORP domain-containing protein n=1 Tax=Microthlaspi erraticum TaxID=1685480 RepID=A0A6D2IUM7_9BRAS|nr:unnamed protein product [Microthlaspi erraticum]